MPKRARLIVNPMSRNLPPRDRLETAPAWLRLHGWDVDTCWTDTPAHGTFLAKQAADDGYECVVAVGGDGTINEVVNGIANTPTALAVIPGGTANVWFREIGGPEHPGSVAALIERGERRTIDLGVAGGRYFILMASLGLDSIVAGNIGSAAKKYLGKAAYALTAVREAARFHGVQAEILADGKRFRAPVRLVLFGNSRSYGGVLRLSHLAHVDDGLLDLVVFRSDRFGGMPAQIVAALGGWHPRWGGTIYRTVQEAEVRTDPPLPVQADGDVIGETPMRFSVARNALTILVEPGSRPEIFKDA